MQITFAPITDLPALEARWRALEAQAEPRFFRGASFLFCQAAARFPAPWLLAVRDGGDDLALGLCNRTGGRFYLHESGAAPWDGLFVEHNGLLCRRDAQAVVAPALRRLMAGRSVNLSGIDAQTRAAAAGGWVVADIARPVPVIDLRALPADEAAATEAYLASLSASTRAQIRRSARRYAAHGGAPAMARTAASLDQALDDLDRLIALHQARFTALGKPGAFADPRIVAFHRELITRAWPTGEVALLAIAAGRQEIGYLYQFASGGRVMNYQAGFVAAAHAQDKPGLLSHTLAIGAARAAGAQAYDLLAGGGRYKTSLLPEADRVGQAQLFWLRSWPYWHPEGAARALRARLTRGTAAAVALDPLPPGAPA